MRAAFMFGVMTVALVDYTAYTANRMQFTGSHMSLYKQH